MRRWAFVPTLLSLTLLAAQDQTRVFTAKETGLGAQLAEQLRRRTTPIGSVKVENYAANIGLRLAAQMPTAQESWKFTVIRDQPAGSTYEPISLPGGWVFIPAELILAVDSEAEFAGMLAHAMAHVAQRHLIRQTNGNGRNPAVIPLIFLGGPTGRSGDDELEADAAAIKTMSRAGFDPASLLSYIKRTQLHRVQNNFSPLPPAAIRISNLEKAIKDQPMDGPAIISTDLFQSIQEELRREISNTRTPRNSAPVPSLFRPER